MDSLLAQTFQNFEVMVVDDCSTDSSCDIIKSYAEKFGGQLTLLHTQENSGSGDLPRNKGLKISDDGSNVRVVNKQQDKLVDKPTFQPDDLAQSVQYILRQDIWGTCQTSCIFGGKVQTR